MITYSQFIVYDPVPLLLLIAYLSVSTTEAMSTLPPIVDDNNNFMRRADECK